MPLGSRLTSLSSLGLLIKNFWATTANWAGLPQLLCWRYVLPQDSEGWSDKLQLLANLISAMNDNNHCICSRGQ